MNVFTIHPDLCGLLYNAIGIPNTINALMRIQMNKIACQRW